MCIRDSINAEYMGTTRVISDIEAEINRKVDKMRNLKNEKDNSLTKQKDSGAGEGARHGHEEGRNLVGDERGNGPGRNEAVTGHYQNAVAQPNLNDNNIRKDEKVKGNACQCTIFQTNYSCFFLLRVSCVSVLRFSLLLKII
eukprot:TRINITY_DN9860_c0_g1_i6.p1 TRINITY_DN9860_c0_g1~~TRINITY_DN9860_c0_g1_i6.p1  ORF type:complete len:142 (-),score=22.05 TRINITY_DN9860_c0_g1_i6:145-570(-)